MLTIYDLILGLELITIELQGTLTCPAGWNSIDLKCYKMSHQSLTFWNAREYCNNHNADVIMPKTTEENNAMKTLLRQVNRTWLWNDGTKLNSANEHWDTEYDEPNGFTIENCVVDHTRTEKWLDISCNWENRAVCQLKDVIVNEGDSVQLTCGVNNMQTSWTRSVNNTSVILSEYANGVSLTNLVFDNVKWSDQGNYECSFTNTEGLHETTVTRLFKKTGILGIDNTTKSNKRDLFKELELVIRQIQDELKVNKTKLSSAIRKLTSAKDDRKSSQSIGYFGAVFISVVFGMVVLIDIVMLKQHIENIWKKVLRHEDKEN
ncbi:unnamed protein product [Mytilus edulis]|uniref:Uncharacterized protein n=1 Tax=Mytilus edulis TaxID=6550 RepID=A0A8S3TPR3_MYTED|nr:unnamed protein product [Mytilus edulis]